MTDNEAYKYYGEKIIEYEKYLEENKDKLSNEEKIKINNVIRNIKSMQIYFW